MSIKENIKLEILKRLEGGEPIDNLTKEYGVSRSSIYQWRSDNAPKSVDNFNISAREIYLLRKEVESLRQPIKISYATPCVKSMPLSQKLEAMKKVEKQFTHASLCKTLDVKKGTFLNHLYRKVEISQIQQTDEIYKIKLLELFSLTEGKLGAKKLSALMKNEGYLCCEKRVSRLMKELDIKCTRTKRANRITIPRKGSNPALKDLLKRDFYPEHPNRVWVSDFSQFNVDYEQKYYICVIIDLFSRKVISYSIANHLRTELLVHTFDQAIEIRQPYYEELIFHSDQGCQLTEFDFRKKLELIKVKQSFSKPGTPYDNAVIESFFSCLKREQLYVEEISNFEDLLYHVGYYIDFYNNRRPHQTLGYKTPAQVESDYASNHD